MKSRITNSTAEKAPQQATPYEIRDADIKGFLLRVQPSGVKTYYYSFRAPDGKKQRIWIGKHGSITATQARDAAAIHAGKVTLGENVQEEKKQTRIKTEQTKFRTLEGFIEHKYKPWVEAERKTGETSIKRLKKNFAHLLSRPLDDINTWAVEKWRGERLKEGIKPATVNRDITTLKAALSKAVDWDVIDKNPLAKLKRVKTDNQGKVRYLKPEEEKRLRAALDAREERIRQERASANEWRAVRGYELYRDLIGQALVDHLKPLVLLALNTGMRRGELFQLCWENVSFAKGTLTIEGADAKSGKTRHIPLNKEALQMLKDWRGDNKKPTGLVFPSHTGKPLDNVKKAWENLLFDAKIKNFRWHDMRHHFASKLVMAGVDLNTVRELLGHSDYTMTLRYAHLAPEHKKEAVERLVFNG
ncbi:MAG: tyrosine-type recombinase/integrase [Rickettsiales bacterium]|nr:tyrosine-type recombinase/integrase [Rickettsiales bacterium]